MLLTCMADVAFPEHGFSGIRYRSTVGCRPLDDIAVAAMAGSLDAATTWLSLPPQTFAVTEVGQSRSVVAAGGWNGAVQVGVAELWIVLMEINLHSRPGYIKVNRPPF